MLCSNCGKDVPFVGKVCPWCKVNKSADQVRQLLAVVGGVAGGVAAWFATEHIGWVLAGFVAGIVAGMVWAERIIARKP